MINTVVKRFVCLRKSMCASMQCRRLWSNISVRYIVNFIAFMYCALTLVENRVGLKGCCRVFETCLGRKIWKSYWYSSLLVL